MTTAKHRAVFALALGPAAYWSDDAPDPHARTGDE